MTYTIVVHDSGPGDAQNIVLTDILDANVSYVSSTPENCTETIGVVTCQLADIVNGTERTLTIVVQINDGGTLTNSVTVIANGGNDPDDSNNKNITLDTSVNAKPVANAGSFSTDEDIAYNGTLTGTDGDNDALTFSIANSGSKGTVTLSDASTGAFSYTPKTNANGTDSFTFKVNDGQIDSATAAVTITINAINDAPMANSGTLAVTPGSVKYSALSATDLDGDQLSYSIVANGSKGTATVINSATGEFSYTPNAGETGTDEFTFKVSDGSTDSNTATIKVTISTASTEQTNNAGNSNGGGGAFDLMLILMLSSLSILRSLVYNRNTNV